jgi:hypothetical protein
MTSRTLTTINPGGRATLNRHRVRRLWPGEEASPTQTSYGPHPRTSRLVTEPRAVPVERRIDGQVWQLFHSED